MDKVWFWMKYEDSTPICNHNRGQKHAERKIDTNLYMILGTRTNRVSAIFTYEQFFILAQAKSVRFVWLLCLFAFISNQIRQKTVVAQTKVKIQSKNKWIAIISMCRVFRVPCCWIWNVLPLQWSEMSVERR